MNDSELSKIIHENDLEVCISNDFKPNKHCSDVKKANKLQNENVFLTLFIALVRPHLEYCIWVWLPYYANKY